MGNPRIVKERIASVEKIKKIANALQIVALTRLKQMEKETINSRYYFDKIRDLLFDVGININFRVHPFFEDKPGVKKAGIIAVFSDKGLCGSFNNSVAHKLKEFSATLKGRSVEVAAVGKKGAKFVKELEGCALMGVFPSSEKETLDRLSEIVHPFIEKFLKKETGEIFLLYSHFKLHLLGEAKIIKLLPFPLEKKDNRKTPYDRDYVYEPSARDVFDALVRRYIGNQIHHAILESRSAEEMSRMLAMKSASDNATEMIKKLELVYNRSRQEQITRELADVINAAKAAV